MSSNLTSLCELGSHVKRRRVDGDSVRCTDVKKELDVSAMLDEEIATLSRALHVARTRRNQVTPSHKLPPEILSKILHNLAIMCPLNLDLRNYKAYGYSSYESELVDPPRDATVNKLAWVNILHTCRYFREIGLGDASLWTVLKIGLFPQCMPPQWASESISRSKSAKIDISVVICYGDDDMGFFKRAMKDPIHASRVRTLSIAENPHDEEIVSDYWAEEPFMNLGNMESLLSLVVEWSSLREESIPVGSKFQAPHLSKLCVRGTIPLHSLPIYGNLAHLELELWIEMDGDTIQDINRILAQTQRLQFFALSDPVPRVAAHLAFSDSRQRYPAALLKNLGPLTLPSSVRRFQVHLNSDASCPITLQTTVPLHAAVDIRMRSPYSPEPGNLIELAQRHGCFSKSHPLRRACLDESAFQFETRPEDNDALARRSLRIDAGLKYHWPCMLPMVDLSTVHELYFCENVCPWIELDESDQIPWSTFFANAHEMQHLVIPHIHADELVRVLSRPPHTVDLCVQDHIHGSSARVGTNETCLLPALHRLTFSVATSEAERPYTQPDMDKIRAALRNRNDIELVFELGKSVVGLWIERAGGVSPEDDMILLEADRLVY
ncbi:hypothetical protein OF83DRAFT_1155943 [Amylostereum chailletii]|nr:hypothetical protein OF83DRAFT_1155943 [Amylostereum chailletii]